MKVLSFKTPKRTMNKEVKKDNEISFNVQFTGSKINIKEEYRPNLKNEVFICETAVDPGNIENDPLEFSDMNNIERKLSTEICNNVKDNIKIEEINVDNIKTEFGDKYLSCNQCHEDYQDYCMNCEMLVHVLNRSADRTQEEIPKNILEVRKSFGHTGIFALKIIPKGVQFGPFTGLNLSNCSWKIKGGRFTITDDKSKFLNWMKYVSSAQNLSEQNLFAYQYEENLYYHSTREIQEGEELLVHFGEEYEDSLINNAEVNFTPSIETMIKDVFACTFCCLGFSSELYLAKHKSICINTTNINSPSEVLQIAQCTFCKIYLEEQEYREYHMNYCYCKNSRDCFLPVSTVHIRKKRPSSLLNKRRRRQVERYKCSHCKYKTTYKADLKIHSNKHYVKVYSCGICHRRFKRKENLKIHMTNLHVNIEEKAYQCSMCEFNTKYKSSLKVHIIGKHSETKKYKCFKCDYETSYKTCLKSHLSSHEKVKRYNCSECAYTTNYKKVLNVHINAKHCETKRFKCSKCEFETPYKYSLINHFYSHDEIKRFKCPECEFETNNKSYLERHKKEKHYEGRKYKYKCSKCKFLTFRKCILKNHLDSHEKVKRFKCPECEYTTHRKSDLTSHFYRHVTTKRFKCADCEYATNHSSSLKRHSRTHKKT